MENENKTFDWDDMISTDGNDAIESVILPDGNYPFEVIKMEKAWYDGSTKLPACNVAKMFLRIDGGELGKGLCVDNLYLCDKFENRAAAFLRAVGLKKHGDPIAWRQLEHCDGETGRCKVTIKQYSDSNNQVRQSNNIVWYFDKEDEAPKKAFKKGAF